MVDDVGDDFDAAVRTCIVEMNGVALYNFFWHCGACLRYGIVRHVDSLDRMAVHCLRGDLEAE